MPDFVASVPLRLDVFLTNEKAVISRVKAAEVIRGGMVLVNGRIARKPALVLTPGDVVSMSDTGEPVTETRLHSSDLSLEVLHEDDACFVLNKPAGISVHPGAGIPKDADTILHGIAHLFAQKKLPFSSAAVLVHRLDKDTTGCLLIAKTPAAHKALQEQFAERSVKKIYLALVAGVPSPAQAVIDASIGRSTGDRTKMTVFGSSKTREARTTYATLASSADAALLSCELHTGRTHQLRVHLHAIQHPILGDASYNNMKSEKMAEQLGIASLCLHAWKLTFRSPADGKARTIEAPPSQSFRDALERAGVAWM